MPSGEGDENLGRALRCEYIKSQIADSRLRDLKFDMKRIAFFLVTFYISILFPSFVLAQPTLKVGSLVPFSGRWGDSGKECARGMLDAAKWLNQRGGIFGRKLDIILIDDTSQAAETMAAYRKLDEADRMILFYIYSTETALALLRHIHFDRIPTLVSSLPSQLSDPSKYPYIFSINPTPLDLSRIGMKFVLEGPSIKVKNPRIVFVGSPDHLGQQFLDEVKQYAKTLRLNTGPDISIPDLSSGQKISSILPAMSQYNPDLAYLSLTSKEAASLFEEVKETPLKTRWLCSMKTFDENLAVYDGVFGVQPISPFGEDVPGMVGIKGAHQRWHPYDTHTLSYVEGWATVQVIAEVLGRSLPEEKLSRGTVKTALEGLKDFVVGGLVPPITITPNDHRPSVESRIFMTHKGKLLRQTGFISVER
jgi:branched-chain amino acid transport system substrate-binding protein